MYTAVIAEIVRVEADWRPVRILEGLFRFESLAEDFGVNHPDPEILDVIEEICFQIIMAVFFHQFNLDFLPVFPAHQVVPFLLPGFGAVQIDVSFTPDRNGRNGRAPKRACQGVL